MTTLTEAAAACTRFRHDAAIAGGGLKWQAVCTCGWVGGRNLLEADAVREAWNHEHAEVVDLRADLENAARVTAELRAENEALKAARTTPAREHLEGYHLTAKVEGCVLCAVMAERDELRAERDEMAKLVKEAQSHVDEALRQLQSAMASVPGPDQVVLPRADYERLVKSLPATGPGLKVVRNVEAEFRELAASQPPIPADVRARMDADRKKAEDEDL